MELNSYSGLPNERVKATNGIDYAYRDTGPTDDGAGVPLVLLQHFRGNLDNWDPALIDALAPARRVIAFDNAGVGGSTGTTPNTVDRMAHDAIAFIEAIGATGAVGTPGLGQGPGPVDVLGFSLGSFVAQRIALTRPAARQKAGLASSAPQGADGMHGWAPEVIGAVGNPETSPAEYLSVFFAGSDASLRAGFYKPCSGSTAPGARTGTRRPAGRPARRSTTRCARGGSPITRSSSGSAA